MTGTYENPITPSDTILFSLKQCRGNVINEAEYLEAEKHYKQIRDSFPDLLEACEAMFELFKGSYSNSPEATDALNSSKAAIRKAKGE